MLATCQQLQREDLTLRRISDRMLRHLLRPLLAADATVADVRHVLHHAPDGQAWSYTTTPNHVPAWVRWRLAHWIGDDGALRATLPSQAAAQRAAKARDRHAAQRARTTDTAAAQARSTRISHSHAATARAMLAAASTRAAATIRAHQERALTV